MSHVNQQPGVGEVGNQLQRDQYLQQRKHYQSLDNSNNSSHQSNRSLNQSNRLLDLTDHSFGQINLPSCVVSGLLSLHVEGTLLLASAMCSFLSFGLCYPILLSYTTNMLKKYSNEKKCSSIVKTNHLGDRREALTFEPPPHLS